MCYTQGVALDAILNEIKNRAGEGCAETTQQEKLPELMRSIYEAIQLAIQALDEAPPTPAQ